MDFEKVLNSVFIVAEMGVNHNGDVETGKRLIEAAAASGADAIKTQMFGASRIVAASAPKARYQTRAVGSGGSQLEMLKKYELSIDDYAVLNDYAASIGIVLFAAPFDIESVMDLWRIGNPIYKIPSGEITNLPYLQAISKLGAKVFMSTGMSSMSEVHAAIDVFIGTSTDLSLMHCNTQYPTDFTDANLKAIVTLREKTGFPVGYSDHTPGFEAAIAAVALGAHIVEKHITLDTALPGPDHCASMTPYAFTAMTKAIRNIEAALGDGVKTATQSEMENMAIARKSIVAARPIRKGDAFGENNLAAKRPGDGISPMRWHDIIGRRAIRDFMTDEKIEL
jgi:N,N'-diacetyllegionaminate synthase